MTMSRHTHVDMVQVQIHYGIISRVYGNGNLILPHTI